MNRKFILSVLLAILALVSLFVWIPFVSNFAFWIMTAAYLLAATK